MIQKFHDLTGLKRFLEEHHPKLEIINFNGWQLDVEGGSFGMFDGDVFFNGVLLKSKQILAGEFRQHASQTPKTKESKKRVPHVQNAQSERCQTKQTRQARSRGTSRLDQRTKSKRREWK